MVSNQPSHVLPMERDVRGLNADEAKRLRQSEQENARLKCLIADQALNLLILSATPAGHKGVPGKKL